MIILFIGVAVLGALVVVALSARYAARIDRAAVARAETRAQQRQAEAEVQRLVQDTIQRMFDTARRRS